MAMSVLGLNFEAPATSFTSKSARAFPGGRLAHPEGQNEEENE